MYPRGARQAPLDIIRDSGCIHLTDTTPRGGEIVSASKFIQGGRSVFFDYERFFTRGTDVIMNPYPGGKKSVEFTRPKAVLAERLERAGHWLTNDAR